MDLLDFAVQAFTAVTVQRRGAHCCNQQTTNRKGVWRVGEREWKAGEMELKAEEGEWRAGKEQWNAEEEQSREKEREWKAGEGERRGREPVLLQQVTI